MELYKIQRQANYTSGANLHSPDIASCGLSCCYVIVFFVDDTPQPLGSVVTVPILPKNLQVQALQQCHDSPAAGHQGSDKISQLLRAKAYWGSMVNDVETYCRQCENVSI